MTNKKVLIKKTDDFIKELQRIKSNYSSIEVNNKFNELHHFIIFTDYIRNSWDLSNKGSVNDFIDFYGLNFSAKDKLNFFYNHFKYYLDYFDYTGNENISNYNIKEFFEKEIYLKLDEEDLKGIKMIKAKDIDIKDFWEYFYKGYMEDFFACVYYTYYDNNLIDCKYNYDKKIIINTLSYLYSVLGDEFEINKNMFNKKQEISFMDFVISYTYIGFIRITSFSISYEENITYGIKILPKFKKILDEIEEKRSFILDKIFDEKYKQITVKKKNGELHLLEGDLEIIGDDTKFVELRNKYPFSKIETEIHNGKANKYRIKEKIKLKK